MRVGLRSPSAVEVVLTTSLVVLALPGVIVASEENTDVQVSAELKAAHLLNVVTSVERFIEGGLLTSTQAFWARHGLEALKTEQADRRAGVTTDSGWDGGQIEPATAELRELAPKRRRQRRFRSTPSELVSSSFFACRVGDQLLLNSRFLVSATFQNLSGGTGVALACGLTR